MFWFDPTAATNLTSRFPLEINWAIKWCNSLNQQRNKINVVEYTAEHLPPEEEETEAEYKYLKIVLSSTQKSYLVKSKDIPYYE